VSPHDGNTQQQFGGLQVTKEGPAMPLGFDIADRNERGEKSIFDNPEPARLNVFQLELASIEERLHSLPLFAKPAGKITLVPLERLSTDDDLYAGIRDGNVLPPLAIHHDGHAFVVSSLKE
jgi:hypothetical protein